MIYHCTDWLSLHFEISTEQDPLPKKEHMVLRNEAAAAQKVLDVKVHVDQLIEKSAKS